MDVSWTEDGRVHAARWLGETGAAPRRVIAVDDTLRADAAYRLACEGTALLWRGDFHNARALLQALTRRVERRRRAAFEPGAAGFHQYRLFQGQRARTLGMLLVPVEPGYRLPLRRAPDVREAGLGAFGPLDEPAVLPLRALLGAVGAHEWRKKGIAVPAIGARIHPHYGVFAPVRSEYVDLVAAAPLSASPLAFDIGTGTGVLAAVLARRGVERVVATERDRRALACARENIERLGLSAHVEVSEAPLFPPGRASLVVCNPPWIPGRPVSLLDRGVYDEDSGMLRGFLAGLGAHLNPEGEAWLVLSDIAERLGLRSREELLTLFDTNGLRVIDRLDARPTHPKAADAADPLHYARAGEITSLWRLRPQ